MANNVFDRLLSEGIPAEQESRLRRIISEAKGSDPVASRIELYETTRTLSDLINLVVVLEEHQYWDDLCKFGLRLFEETHSVRDAERLINAYNNTHRSEALVSFLKENSDLLSQSDHLHMSYAWGLYLEGAFVESSAVLAKLGRQANDPNYRALRMNLGIATGDWASLSSYVADEYRDKDNRNARSLMETAQLALHLGLPHSKELVFEAAAKANDDPVVLAAAYMAATSGGWEDEPQIFRWLEKAAELSVKDGPLQKISLKDLADQKPEWDRRELETWRLLAQGQIPGFIAAQSLNRTLISLSTIPALTSITKIDPRLRSAIPAYSGRRVSSEFEMRGKTVALDATTLLTLSFLNILDVALDIFETIYIPHSTLGWLFQEQQKATFHQPSRIANARKIRDLLATDQLKKFAPSTTSNSELSSQVGDELAALIAEAEKTRDGDAAQHIVVRSAPVYRLSSFMEEEVDLSAHATVFSSCLAVVEKLRQKGQITASEEKRARSYLQLQEKPWPNQPAISDNATLYLDDLAVSYLQHLGLLGKLSTAGLTAMVSPKELSEIDTLISSENISRDVKEIIENIRASINSLIKSKKVMVSRRCKIDEFEDQSILEHPSVGVFDLAARCDFIVIDDRFFNRHLNLDSNGVQTPVISSLELLDSLVRAGVLSDHDRLEHKTRLRKAGYFFIPVSVEELEKCLREATIINGKVIETTELKAIRESVLQARMNDWLQLPEEAPWLDGVLNAFASVFRILWNDEAGIENIKARSNWLIDQIDLRGWAHSFVSASADNVINLGRAPLILSLLVPPCSAQQCIADNFWNWVEEKILVPLLEEFPREYEWLVEWHRNYITDTVAHKSISEKEITAVEVLQYVPPLIRKTLLNDHCFKDEIGLKTNATITFNGDISFQRSLLFNAIRRVLSGECPTALSDFADRIWNLSIDSFDGMLPKLTLSYDQQRLNLPEFSVLSEDASKRICSLEESAADVNLSSKELEEWRRILEKRALVDDEVETFHADLRDTPVYVERTIRDEIIAGKCSVSSFVPNSLRYFERLIGAFESNDSIQEYAISTGRRVFRQLAEWRPYEGFLFSLLVSSHSTLTAEMEVDHLEQKELEKAFKFLEVHGDMLSRLGAIEAGLRLLPDRPQIEPFLLRLVHRIRDDDVESETSEFKLLSALFVLVDGELARTRLLAEKPPFYRRLASLSQAAMIHRQIIQCEMDYVHFSNWALNNRGQQFYLQSLVDMRAEPRWNPDLADALQIKAEFIGRLMNAGNSCREYLKDVELRETILCDGKQSIAKLCEFPRPYYPGPLEGAEDSPITLPKDLSLIIEEQLNNDVEASSFITLVNSAMICKIKSDHAELATKALILGNHTLANLEGRSQLLGILRGLATVAAVSRNAALADEIRILVRCYRRDSEYGFSIEDALRIVLVASAARENFMEWKEFAGGWLTELAFGELEINETKTFYSHLLALLHSVPELWVSSARAEAALQALCFR